MKHTYLIASMALAAICLASCDNRPKVQGAWQGEVTQNMPGDVRSMITTYTFEKDGKAEASYLWNISQPLQTSDSIISAYEVSVSGTASMEGRWSYASGENDEVVITFTPSSLKVDVDPEAVQYRENLLSGSQAPAVDSLRPAIADKYADMMSRDFSANGMTLRLTDIEVKDNSMKFDIGDSHCLFKKL